MAHLSSYSIAKNCRTVRQVGVEHLPLVCCRGEGGQDVGRRRPSAVARRAAVRVVYDLHAAVQRWHHLVDVR